MVEYSRRKCPSCGKRTVMKKVFQTSGGQVMPSGESRLSDRFKFGDGTVMYYHETTEKDCYREVDFTSFEGRKIKGEIFQI